MNATVTTARQRQLIPEKPQVAADSTGYEARVISGYFAMRSGRRIYQKRWPKLTAVLDTQSHIFLSARVTRGPSQDAPHLIPVARDAVATGRIDTLLGDAAYDSEDNHAKLREKLGIRSTVIPLNWRGSRKWPQTRYRRQMVRRFRKKPRKSRHKRVYGQRWQVEMCQADYPSSRRWVWTRRIGYHRRDGVARTGHVVPATTRQTRWSRHMSDTRRRTAPPRA